MILFNVYAKQQHNLDIDINDFSYSAVSEAEDEGYEEFQIVYKDVMLRCTGTYYSYDGYSWDTPYYYYAEAYLSTKFIAKGLINSGVTSSTSSSAVDYKPQENLINNNERIIKIVKDS
jgi:hypothetical protein